MKLLNITVLIFLFGCSGFSQNKRDQLIGNSIEDVGRLDDLVENMLLATRIENNSYSYPKELFDFSELVKSIFDRAIITSENTRNFQQQIEEKISIMGDRFALGSLINNILENAIKYSPAGAAIQVQLYQQSNKIFFIVADQGVGIADSELQKIFQKFYRSGNELTRQNKGTGLGLSIVKKIVLLLNGKIDIQSDINQGTTFTVIIPLNENALIEKKSSINILTNPNPSKEIKIPSEILTINTIDIMQPFVLSLSHPEGIHRKSSTCLSCHSA